MSGEWYRARKAANKYSIAMAHIDLPAHIKAELEYEARRHGITTEQHRFVYSRRDDEWYVSFGLDVNPPDHVIETMQARGWKILL